MKKLTSLIIFSCLALYVLMSPNLAEAQNVVLGMNASMGSLAVDQQNAILSELHDAGVHFIRAGITPDDKGIDFRFNIA